MSSLSARCKAARLLLIDMATAVSAYTRSNATQLSITSLFTLCSNFDNSLDALVEYHPSILGLRGCFVDTPSTFTSRALAAEHLLYISALTSFINAALDKLDHTLMLALDRPTRVSTSSGGCCTRPAEASTCFRTGGHLITFPTAPHSIPHYSACCSF